MLRGDPTRRVPASGTGLTLLLVAASGHPVLTNPALMPVVLLALFLWVTFERRGMLSMGFLRRYGVIAAALVLIFVSHQLQLGLISLPGSVFFLLKVFAGGLVISHFGRRFNGHLFQAVFYICAVSLVFYPVLLYVGPDAFPTLFGEDLAGPNHKSIVVFTVVTNLEWWRNAGMMWEPGAFQAIINLSILLMPAELLTTRRYRVRLIIVVAALLTTFSTTGYITFFLLAAFKLGRFKIPPALKWSAIVLVVAVGTVTFTQADFLGEKIAGQIESSAENDDFAPDRFGALLFDFYYIEKHPVFGNGLIETTRYADHPYLWGVALGHGNGMSNFAASFGLFGLLGYFFAIVRSRMHPVLGVRVFAAFIVALLVFGEPLLNYPLFLGLPFVVAGGVLAPRRRARGGVSRLDSDPLGIGHAPKAPQPAPDLSPGIRGAGGNALRG